MGWGGAIAGAGSVVGGVMASKSARDAADASLEAAEAQIDWEKEMYADWKAIYGDIEQNLANYYENLTPEYYASMGLEAFNLEYQTSQTRMSENLAQRGIAADSGIATSLESQNELGAAETRAGIRRDAASSAAAEKSNFLQIGMGSNPSAGVSNAYSQATKNANQNSQIANQAAGNAWSNAIPVIGGAIGQGIDSYSNNTNSNNPNSFGNSGYYPGNNSAMA